MSSVFTNKKSKNIGVSPVTVGSYTVPTNTTSTVIGLSISNTTENNIKVSVSIRNAGTEYYILKDANIIPGQAHAVVGGDMKLVLTTGDSVTVVSDTAQSVDVVMSMMELS